MTSSKWIIYNPVLRAYRRARPYQGEDYTGWKNYAKSYRTMTAAQAACEPNEIAMMKASAPTFTAFYKNVPKPRVAQNEKG